VTSLGFPDFTQLLGLAEQSGPTDSRTKAAVKDDQIMVRAVGAHSVGQGDQSTAELLLSIP
jgi:hypothetical protein